MSTDPQVVVPEPWPSEMRRFWLAHLVALEAYVAAAVREHLRTGDSAWEQQAQGIRDQISWLKQRILDHEAGTV